LFNGLSVRFSKSTIFQMVRCLVIARRFHEAVAHGILEAAQSFRGSRNFEAVVLSGGVFQNKLLTELAIQKLEDCGFTVWINRHVPPNDGGISLGQVALAAASKEA
jgi:hydrogenase maturation protein HypF